MDLQPHERYSLEELAGLGVSEKLFPLIERDVYLSQLSLPYYGGFILNFLTRQKKVDLNGNGPYMNAYTLSEILEIPFETIAEKVIQRRTLAKPVLFGEEEDLGVHVKDLHRFVHCPPPTDDVSTTVIEYQKTRNPKLLEKILQGCEFHARCIATRFIPFSILDFDDFLSIAFTHIVELIEDYDPHRGARFTTYIKQGIHGKIQDALREIDPLPRSLRKYSKEIDELRRSYNGVYAKEPTPEYIAEITGLSLEIVLKTAEALQETTYTSLSEELPHTDDMSREEGIEDKTSPNPHVIAETNDLLDTFHDSLHKAYANPKSAQAVYYAFLLHRICGYALRDIGKELGVTDSRVSQMFSDSRFVQCFSKSFEVEEHKVRRLYL